MVLALFAAVSVPSFSADSELISEYQNISSNVTYENPSNYRVVIPATINANADSIVFTAESMHIKGNEQLILRLRDDVELLNTDNNNIKANFSFNTELGIGNTAARFYSEELTSNIIAYPYIENARDIPAGEYNGTATFEVVLSERN